MHDCLCGSPHEPLPSFNCLCSARRLQIKHGGGGGSPAHGGFTAGDTNQQLLDGADEAAGQGPRQGAGGMAGGQVEVAPGEPTPLCLWLVCALFVCVRKHAFTATRFIGPICTLSVPLFFALNLPTAGATCLCVSGLPGHMSTCRLQYLMLRDTAQQSTPALPHNSTRQYCLLSVLAHCHNNDTCVLQVWWLMLMIWRLWRQ